MARRSISLSEGMENGIRKWQAVMMVEGRRDVTFTEALQNVLIRGFISGGSNPMTAWWKGESQRNLTPEELAELLEGSGDTRLQGVLDLLPDEVADNARKALAN